MATRPDPLSTFKELDYDVLHHDIRVFIQGVEVTSDLMGTLVVRIEKNASPNAASFQLDNALDKYYITTVNLPDSTAPGDTVFSDARGKYSERAKRDLYKFKVIKKTQEANSSAIKDVFNTVFLRLNQGQQSSETTVQTSSVAANTADTQSIKSLTAEVVANLPDKYFVNPGSDDGLLVISASQAASSSAVDPNQNSANNTVLTLVNELDTAYPNVPHETNFEVAKNAVQARMRGETQGAPNPVPPKPRKINPQDPFTGSFRWEFHPGDCILTQLDPVVIFATNPLAPEDSDEWMPVFTGFLTDLNEAKDHLTGESKLSIVAQDIRFLMAKMRVASNTITGIKTPEAVYNEEAGLFQDLIASTGGRTVQFSGKTFEDTVAFILTGIQTLDAALKGDKSGSDTLRGVGSLFMRQKVNYPPDNSAGPKFETVATGQEQKYAIPIPVADPNGECAKLLEKWHTFSLLGGGAGHDSSYTGRFLSYAECTAIGSTTYTGHDKNDPINRGVNLLLPKNGSKLQNMISFGIIKGGQDSFNFRDRLDIFSKVVDVLNYVFYVAPHGDLMIEFPFYDFLVDDFGYWGKVFTFDRHLISSSTVLEKPDIVTGVVVTGGYDQTLPQGTVNNPTLNKNNTVVISSPKLAARYGLKSENLSFPYSFNQTDIAAYGMLKFQEFLGEANSLSMQSVFRPFLLPNRPILNTPDSKLGITKSIENTWNIFQTCSTTYNLTYIRTRQPVSVNPDATAQSAKVDSWRFLTGGCVMGLSYRYAYGVSGSGNPNDPFAAITGNKLSGIRIVPAPGSTTGDGSDVTSTATEALTPGIASDSELNSLSSADRTTRCDPDGKISGTSINRLKDSAKAALQNIVREACVTMYVTSAVRTEEENTRVHGSPTSAHLTGFAWDARLRNPSTGHYVYTDEELVRIQKAAQNNGYTLLNETDHLHFEPHKQGTAWFQHLPTAAQRALDRNVAEQKRAARNATRRT